MMRSLVFLGVALFAAGCMEVEQTAGSSAKTPGQTVKRDTAPWNDEPLAFGPKWTKGDRASWEEQIKKRQLYGQHEFTHGNQ